MSLAEFRRIVALHVEVLNEAIDGHPARADAAPPLLGQLRGAPSPRRADPGDHGQVLRARPAGLSFEGANPRHAHEWKIWREVKLPAGKVLIPGVIDTTTNFIEHPELVAERIARYARSSGGSA